MSSGVVNKPVHSITTSISKSFHGRFSGFLSANILMPFPLTSIDFSFACIVPWKGPWTESNLKNKIPGALLTKF